MSTYYTSTIYRYCEWYLDPWNSCMRQLSPSFVQMRKPRLRVNKLSKSHSKWQDQDFTKSLSFDPFGQISGKFWF